MVFSAKKVEKRRCLQTGGVNKEFFAGNSSEEEESSANSTGEEIPTSSCNMCNEVRICMKNKQGSGVFLQAVDEKRGRTTNSGNGFRNFVRSSLH